MTHGRLYHALLALFFLVFTRLASAGTIRGRLVLPEEEKTAASLDRALDRSLYYATLFSTNSDNTFHRRKAFVDSGSGSFRFDDVADGVYSLDVEASPYVFSAVKVTVKDGAVKEALASEVGNAQLPLDLDEGLRMVPLRITTFFEQRGKFSLWAFLKTPYGAMIGFALFSIVVMPYLKVDPEEYRQMKRELSQMTGGGNDTDDNKTGKRK